MIDADRRPIPTQYRALFAAGRGLAIVGTWAVALGIAVAAFPAGSRGGREAIPFGLSFAIASGLAGAVTLAVGGRRRLAIEAVAAIVGAVGLAAAAIAGMLWLAPFAAQRIFGLGSQEVLFYRRWLVADVGRLLASPGLPPAPILGLVVGAIAGLLARLGRRWPGLAAGLAVGLLVAVGASASLVAGLVAEFVLDVRREHGMYRAGRIRPLELDGTIGAVVGSIIGSVIACGALRGHRAAPDKVDRPPMES